MTNETTPAYDAAAAAMAEAERQLAAAMADLAAAEQAVAAAKARLADHRDTDAAGAMDALDRATAARTRQHQLISVLEGRLAARRGEAAVAWGERNRPDFERGVAGRIAAAAKADKARALLAEAEAEHEAATVVIHAAHARGLVRPFDGAAMTGLTTEALERAIWERAA